MSESIPAQEASADAVMDEVRRRVSEELWTRVTLRGASADFADRRVFDAVDALFRRALVEEDRRRLMLPDIFEHDWTPDLALRLSSHRRGAIAAIILFAKRNVLRPLMHWLFEYSLENFRKQDKVNVALMACLQTIAADHAALRIRVAEFERTGTLPPTDAGGSDSQNR